LNEKAEQLEKEFRDDVRHMLEVLKTKIDHLQDVTHKKEYVDQIGSRVTRLEGDKKMILGGVLVLQFIGGGVIWFLAKLKGG